MLKLIKETGYRVTPSGSKRKMGLFKCDCGAKKEICISNVKRGLTKSCGCANIRQVTALGKVKGKDRFWNYYHGMSGDRFYKIYHSMNIRCADKKNKYYGGAGIKNEFHSFEDFMNVMYKGYLKHVEKYGEKQTTLDRIDSLGNYSKDNCRWATYSQQHRNKSNNRYLTINNKTKLLVEWCKILNRDSDYVLRIAGEPRTRK